MPLQQTDSLSNISSLLSLVKGSGTTTSTTSSNISAAGIQQMLDDILGGSQGLAATAVGQSASGGYNSTTNQLLQDNLIAKTAGVLAEKQAGTTTTTKKGATFSPGQILTGVGGLALDKILGPSVKTLADKTGISNLGDQLKNKLFGDGTSVASDAGSSGLTGVQAVTPETVDASGSITDTLPGLISSTGDDAAAGVSDAAFGGASDAAADAAVASVPAATTDVAGLSALDAGAADAGVDAAAADGVADAALTSGAVDVGADAAIGAGADAAAGGGLADALTGAVAAWIVCTELVKQNRIPKRWYIYGLKRFNSYDEVGKQGYYYWAVPAVRHLRRKPSSRLSAFLSWMMNHRAEYIAASCGEKTARSTITGRVVYHGLYAFCWTLSRTLARKQIDWAGEVYGRN